MQIWFLSNGSYSLKKCHNPFGKAIQPPPPYGKIPVEHWKSKRGASPRPKHSDIRGATSISDAFIFSEPFPNFDDNDNEYGDKDEGVCWWNRFDCFGCGTALLCSIASINVSTTAFTDSTTASHCSALLLLLPLQLVQLWGQQSIN